MHEVLNAVEKYKAQMLESGMKETTIEELKQAADCLEKSNAAQETRKNNRSVKTEDRINLMNELYNLLLDSRKAAKLVFFDVPAKLQRYILPHNRSVAAQGGGHEDVSPAA